MGNADNFCEWVQVVRGRSESISSADQSPPSSPLPASTPTEKCDANDDNAISANKQVTPTENCDANDSNAISTEKQVTPTENCDSTNKQVAPTENCDANDSDSNAICVLDENTWPSLVESARALAISPKLSAQASINLPPQQQATNNAKSNHNLKQPVVARQRYSRRGGGGGGGSSMGGPARGFYNPSRPPPPPPYPVYPMPGTRAVGGFRPQTNFPTYQWNFYPVKNLAFHPRGDAHYHYYNHAGERDHDRRIYSNVQDARFQNHMLHPRGFMSPSPPYIAQFPHHVRPHGNPIPPPRPEFAYAHTLPMDPDTNIPPMAPMAPTEPRPPMPQPSGYNPEADLSLSASLVYQIEYYFSDDNLIKDAFLRSNMDDQGWVPISLIAGFSKVKALTTNIELIVEALKTSTKVELEGSKIRKRNGWMKWPLKVRTDSKSSGSNHGNHDNDSKSVRK